MRILDLESEPIAVAVTLSADAFRVMPDDGRASSVPPTRFPRLLHGTSEQRQDSEPIGRGEDLHREIWTRMFPSRACLAGRGERTCRQSYAPHEGMEAPHP